MERKQAPATTVRMEARVLGLFIKIGKFWVPLPNYGVAGKYALALYITTVWKNALELVEADLQQVCGAAETNLVLADFHKDPSVSKTVRVKAIVEIFKNIKFNDVMENFLGFILLRFAFYSCIGREWKALTAATDHFYIYNFCWLIEEKF
ncbi:unnamed protein product [Sphagnum balticum]